MIYVTLIKQIRGYWVRWSHHGETHSFLIKTPNSNIPGTTCCTFFSNPALIWFRLIPWKTPWKKVPFSKRTCHLPFSIFEVDIWIFQGKNQKFFRKFFRKGNQHKLDKLFPWFTRFYTWFLPSTVRNPTPKKPHNSQPFFPLCPNTCLTQGLGINGLDPGIQKVTHGITWLGKLRHPKMLTLRKHP